MRKILLCLKIACIRSTNYIELALSTNGQVTCHHYISHLNIYNTSQRDASELEKTLAYFEDQIASFEAVDCALKKHFKSALFSCEELRGLLYIVCPEQLLVKNLEVTDGSVFLNQHKAGQIREFLRECVSRFRGKPKIVEDLIPFFGL